MSRHWAVGVGPRGQSPRVALFSLLLAFAAAACSSISPTASQTRGSSQTASARASARPSAIATSTPSASPATTGFVPTGSMRVGRDGHTATLLSDGRVLVAGGLDTADASHPLPSAELYEPKTGTFSSTGSMAVARSLHTATLLHDGRVLIVGGYDFDDFTGTGEATGTGESRSAATPMTPDLRRIAELYDPAKGTFSRTGSMSFDRYGHTATLLNDGRVLIAGGESLKSGISASAELYSPKTGVFSVTGSMSTTRTGHTATLLPEGEVLITGGYDSAGLSLASAELYDPTTGKFRLTDPMSVVRTNHTSTLLPDGRVLIAGGRDANGDQENAYSSAELYDPGSGTFSATESMWVPRTGHTATLLSNGHVLLTGSTVAGSGGTGRAQITAELYDPTTGSFGPTEGMDEPHDTATSLSDGGVLVTGGAIAVTGGSEFLATAELYRP
jgi:hypothetical protein